VVTFEGAALKTNASVAIDGGSAKLIVLDLDDPRPDLWIRVTLPASSSRGFGMKGARLTMVDAQNRESVLTSNGVAFASDGTTAEHRLSFNPKRLPAGESPRRLLLEVPTSKGPAKKVAFRIPEVPVNQSGE